MAYDQLTLTDPVTLRDDALLALFRRQLDARALPAAERAVDKLAERTSFEPARIDLCRARLIEAAVVARRYGIAHRQFARLHDVVGATVDPIALAGLALRMSAPDARDHLNTAAESAVSDASGLRALNLAHVLLATAPALGILVARGAIRREDGWEPEILLDTIDEARVRLGLAPGDPAAAVHDALGERLEAKRLRAEVEARPPRASRVRGPWPRPRVPGSRVGSSATAGERPRPTTT